MVKNMSKIKETIKENAGFIGRLSAIVVITLLITGVLLAGAYYSAPHTPQKHPKPMFTLPASILSPLNSEAGIASNTATVLNGELHVHYYTENCTISNNTLHLLYYKVLFNNRTVLINLQNAIQNWAVISYSVYTDYLFHVISMVSDNASIYNLTSYNAGFLWSLVNTSIAQVENYGNAMFTGSYQTNNTLLVTLSNDYVYLQSIVQDLTWIIQANQSHPVYML